MADTKPLYYVPAVGTKGAFSFQSPFDSILFSNQEYEVKSIRSLKELYDSEEDPFTNIYSANNLTEEEFKTDLDNNIPIIVLANDANQYYYVPATKLSSLPKLTGVKYQEVMLVINLGYLPVDIDVSSTKDDIESVVSEKIGVTSSMEIIKTSAIQLVDDAKDEEYTKLREKNMNRDTWRTKYKKLETKYNDALAQLDLLHTCIEQHNVLGNN
jgi:hypothetical protein